MSAAPQDDARAGPLAGLTVLDMTLALAGPYATFLLAALGARVIKIENAATPDPCRENAPFLGQHGVSLGRSSEDDVSVAALNRLRGKYAVTLDLKREGSRAVFADLVRQADILVENFSPGAMQRLGVDYAFAKALNPRIIYCSISGYGAGQGNGKAMDSIIQALSGLMMTSGNPQEPPVRVGVPFADLMAPVFAVTGVLAALRQRDSTGMGQHVDVSMLGVLSSLVAAEPFDLLEACGIPQRTGRTVPRLAPFGVFESADGYVAICAPTEHFARGVFAAMGRDDLATDPRFCTRDARVENVEALHSCLEAFTRALPTARVVELLELHGVPAAPVRSPAAAVRDPRVLARGETRQVEHPRFGRVADVIGPGMPIRFSDAPATASRPAPGVGQDNELVYGSWLGYDAATLARLRAAGNI
jgi:crotonobetainyl-CoA:carnitine CoA-transferase CaiB-like acyl-CoA transferase